jgi:hypothetical protein
MYDEFLPVEIIKELEYHYPTLKSRKNLKLDTNLIKEVFNILEEKGYNISSTSTFPTENFSSTALSQFEDSITNWVQPTIEYLAAEQIIRDLIVKGWNVIPPKGV